MKIVLPFPPATLSGHNKGGPWRENELQLLREAYRQGVSSKQIAPMLGRSRGAIRNQAYKLGITAKDSNFSVAEINEIRAAYAGEKKRGELNLDRLSERMGRPKSSICKKAGEMGLTSATRPGVRKPKVDRRKYKTDDERKAALSARMRQQHKERGHPMQGKKHSEESRRRMSAASKAAWLFASDEKRAAWSENCMKSRVARRGSIAPPRPSASWKAGWREIGGKRNYYRSRWEANYARYLEWLKQRAEIADWQHEPETFWFEAIKRGVRSYLPDFRVWEKDGSTALHEVKGWMDARSKTTLKRMAKYHPQERVIVIREKQYNEIARKIGPMIEGWESGGRADRP